MTCMYADWQVRATHTRLSASDVRGVDVIVGRSAFVRGGGIGREGRLLLTLGWSARGIVRDDGRTKAVVAGSKRGCSWVRFRGGGRIGREHVTLLGSGAERCVVRIVAVMTLFGGRRG